MLSAGKRLVELVEDHAVMLPDLSGIFLTILRPDDKDREAVPQDEGKIVRAEILRKFFLTFRPVDLRPVREDEHILLSAGQMQISALVEKTEVSRIEPAVDRRVRDLCLNARSRRGKINIPLHETGRFDAHFPVFLDPYIRIRAGSERIGILEILRDRDSA